MLNQLNLMQGLADKMDYLSARQRVLAQNIANADTPGYRPKDLQTPDFSKTLGQAAKAKASVQPIALATTQSNHMGASNGGQGASQTLRTSRNTYEVAPAENAVVIEEQMVKASDTALNYQMITNIYNKNIDLLRIAIRGR